MPSPSSPTAVTIAAKSLMGFAPGGSRLTHRGAARISWTLVGGTTTRIEKQQGAGAWALGAVAPDGYNTADVGDLIKGQTYKFRVRAENGSGVSAYVETGTWTVPLLPTAPGDIGLPSALAAGSITARRATLTWSDAADNDSGFVIRLTPGGGGLSYVYVEALEGSVVLSGLQPSTTYGAAIAPVGGRYNGRPQALGYFGGYPLLGAFSADVQFATTADAIEIVPPPAQYAYVGRAFSLRVNFTEAATTSSGISGAPSGLTATADASNLFTVIAGTPADDAGKYLVTVSADNGTSSDSVDFPITVWRPSITPYWPAIPARGSAGVAFTHIVAAALSPAHTPPAGDPITYTATGLPSWATLATNGIVTGTPDAAGTWTAQITASNGVETVEAPLTITVTGVAITSPATTRIYVGQAFSFALTTAPARATFSTDDSLPAGVALDGKTFTGTPTAEGTYPIDLVATSAVGEANTDSQSFTFTVLPLFTTAQIDAQVGDPTSGTVTFNGRGTKVGWQIIGAPDGITIADDSTLCPKGFIAKISGTPAANTEGFYEATVSVVVRDVDGKVRTYQTKVTITVSGGLLLGWLHNDPENRDLQVFPRTREVKSFYGTNDYTLWLKRGDDARLFVVFRDGKSELLDLDQYDEVRILFREEDQFDAEPFWVLGGADVPITTFTGHRAFQFDFSVDNPAVEDRFAHLNEAAGADKGSRQLSLMGEVEYVLGGRTISTQSFKVVIAQDVLR